MNQRLSLPALLALVLAFPLAGAAPADRPISSPAAPYPMIGVIERFDPAFDQLIAPDAQMETLATGFDWSEGPVWDFANGQLYFSDVPQNIVYAWSEASGISIFLSPSGFTGETYDGNEPGSNGLAFDLEGNLVLCQHGDRRVARLNERRWGYTTLADAFEGRELQSPNDLCFDAEGNLFFTDPPYGRPREYQREQAFCAFYQLAPDGTLRELSRQLRRPNGIALSPDGRYLYVGSTAGEQPFVMRFARNPDGTVAEGEVFFDVTPYSSQTRQGLPDGLKVDTQGNVWTTGPGGVYVLNPQGKLLGALLTGRRAANCAFGGPEGCTLFITSDDTLVRVETLARGHFPSRRP